MIHQLKMGRQARTFNPRIPHLSALIAGKKLPPPPPQRHWTQRDGSDPTVGMQPDFGVMLNDSLGDCTIAGYFHACQVWNYHTGHDLIHPDNCVEKLYEMACGYNPADPSTDQGGVEQDVLTYILKSGAPVGLDCATAHRLSAFLEVDPRNQDDIKRTINEFAVSYIGFEVPQSVMPTDGPVPAIWDFVPGNSAIIGGHCVILTGYTDELLDLVSWGQRYQMTWKFFHHFVDETYAIADAAWINQQTDQTVCGLTLAQLEAQMAALKAA